ncbi:dihydrolipoamide acetyltransferase family protein [Brevibacillus panacihumi]|uniref:dihydrolipoamide acetyltransferase family protein n=1 Tax=Brevibacillus panacihumi TaxID=497735 RepID=UPI003D200032
MVEFKLPDVGEGMHEGEITRWLVKEGDFVKRDQPVVEVQTDKVNAELTSPATGVVSKMFFAVGDTVEVGATLYLIQPEGEEEKKAAAVPPPAPRHARALATPYVRQMAREMSIDLEDVVGTGPAGRVVESDLIQYAERKKAGPTPDNRPKVPEAKTEAASVKPLFLGESEERIPLKGIRKKIAEHLTKSATIIPHVTHVDELEMDAVKEWRDRIKEYADRKNIKLTFLPFFIKAIVIALKEFPTLNASIDDETNEIVLKHYYHIGIATDTEDGLIVPVIKHADQKTILELAAEISQLSFLAREGKLTLDQISGGTFTISNVGPIGGLQATPIINHPEVAILALHKMEPRMVVRNWEGVIRLMMNMSLSFDHRLIDGVTAVRFTNRIKELLENPNLLFAELR